MATSPDTAARVRAALAALQSHAEARIRDEMGPRYGITGASAETAFGTPMAKIKLVAKSIGRDQALAGALWETGVYEARMLAAHTGEADKLTPERMDRWRADFDNWAICDTACFQLFDRSPHALAMVDRWAALNDEFGRRAGFALLACLALHRKELADADFLARLPLIERHAADDRNFVKKAVNWALRAIGRRNAALKGPAAELARRLSESKDKTERWVGRDAVKQIEKT
ncbi:MAG: DNA alkylation repair protein [Maricaulaceae bacterium]|nr:DNA alkylation repair protein [Maricaulaceae bacterium]